LTRYLDPLDSAFVLLEVPGSAMKIGAVIELDFGGLADPTVLSLGGKMVDAFGLFDVVPPMANLMLSSVPGPPIPLWLSGHRVVSAAPVGPLLGPFSLNVTVLGFEHNLEFGMLGCAQRMPDLATLRDYLRDEATALIDTASD
jgi:diacylglycerol O-acyltransferase